MNNLITLALFVVTVVGAYKLLVLGGILLDMRSYVIGIAVAGVIAFLSFILHSWWGSFTNAFRPQVVVLQTKESPVHVMGCAGGGLFLWLIGVIVIGIVGYFVFFKLQ